jgi:hypothetical protein
MAFLGGRKRIRREKGKGRWSGGGTVSEDFLMSFGLKATCHRTILGSIIIYLFFTKLQTLPPTQHELHYISIYLSI